MITVFPHIIAAATILFWIHLVRKLFKFSFPLCNNNLNSFLTRWGNYSRRENYSREETIWGNAVYVVDFLSNWYQICCCIVSYALKSILFDWIENCVHTKVRISSLNSPLIGLHTLASAKNLCLLPLFFSFFRCE